MSEGQLNAEVEQRFDRQIRLWGPVGQKAIMESSIVVVGSDCVATEFLKSIVLHGVQNVTIIDDAIVTEEDLGTNFFVEPESIGKPRAEVTASLLTELNPFATIKSIKQNTEDLTFVNNLDKNDFLVTTGLKPTDFYNKLSKICREKGIRSAHILTSGFFGSFYVDGLNHHYIEGSAPTKYPNELRILNPFPELEDFFKSLYNFDTYDLVHYGHMLYPVILYRARMEVMKENNITKLTRAHRNLLEAKIESFRRLKEHLNSEAEDPYEPADCIEEARDHLMFAYGDVQVPLDTLEAFKVSEKIGDVDEPFWRLVRGTKKFFDKHGVLPHYGDVEDMEAHPDYFRQLKAIYQNKSKKDWEEVLTYVGNDIDPEYVQRFAHNVWRIGGVKFIPISETINKATNWDFVYDENGKNHAATHSLFIALHQFIQKYNHPPMNNDEDKTNLFNLMKATVPECHQEYAQKFAQEFARFNATYLPSVVATLSAILAEEVTKILIQQAKPVNGAVYYDAIHGNCYNPDDE